MSNHLCNQTSPYLLQHANNPVDWHAWGEPALALASARNQPILLSIGYAACHWCHVMAHESFENPRIAKIMNEHFICIKVDREERPDLDKIYQLAHQMLTERAGGWPLTIVMTPDGHAPFFAGTYFPPESRFNLRGFPELLEDIVAHYQAHADKLKDHHHIFSNALIQLNPMADSAVASHLLPQPVECLKTACADLNAQFDTTFGGFGGAPKFPHSTQLELLLQGNSLGNNLGVELKNSNLDQRVELTLDRMALGGLFDHLGGGFFRYSVDREWKIPHFEKMLYDNAQLLALYAQAAAQFGGKSKRLYRETAEATAEWIIREMQQESGGFSATLDADSEGQEGKYYVWEQTDLSAILIDEHFNIIENYFALFGEPNFDGKWHFNVGPEVDLELLWASADTHNALNLARENLLKIREQRVRPDLDEKVIASWNGLAISALAKAGRILNQPSYIESAQKSLTFIRNNHWRGDRMLSVCTQGQAALNAYLDDYAFVLMGVLDLLEAQWRSSDLEFAIDVCDAMIKLFEDAEMGGFFFTSHDHEKLLYRPKYGADDSIPAGNGAAILGLLKLGMLIGESRYLDSAHKALQLFTAELQKQPSVNALMTLALQHSDSGYGGDSGDGGDGGGGDGDSAIMRGGVVIVRGSEEEIRQWRGDFYGDLQHDFQRGTHHDNGGLTSVYWIPSTTKNLPPGLAVKNYPGTAVAYLCQGMTCSLPLNSPQALTRELAKHRGQ